MTLYDKIQRQQEDFVAAAAYVGEIQGTLTYLHDAIRRRIAADQTEILGKISELEEQIADPSMSEPVRRLVAAELAKLKQTTFSPSAAEREAYEKEIEGLRTAQADLVGLKDDICRSVDDLENELAEIKAWLTADNTLTDLPRLIAAEEMTYKNLCAEVHLDEQ